MSTFSRLLRLGAILGAGYGLVEGMVSAGLSFVPGTLSWEGANAPEALLVAPLFYIVVYAAVGGFVGLVSGVRPGLPWDRLLKTGLSGLSACLLAGQLGHYFGGATALLLGLGVGTVAWRAGAGRRGASLDRLTPGRTALALLAAPLPGLALVVLLAWAEHRQVAALPTAPAGAPNVLLLVLDTERADHLGAYGYARPTTPHLDRLAAEGVLYEVAIAGSPTTLPSHATLMTGRRVVEHRAGELGTRHLSDAYPTLAEVLGAAGWRTGGFVANTYWTGRHTGLNRGFQHYADFYGTLGDAIARTALGRRASYALLPYLGAVDIPGRKGATTVNREFLEWTAQDRSRPFFAFLNYFDVHAPYLPPAATAGRFEAGEATVPRPTKIEIGAWNEHDHLPDSTRLAHWRNAYDESLMALDAELGVLFDSLTARGQLNQTVVIVVGDHGEGFGEHGMVHHGGGLYQDQVRVPLIIRYPALVPAGSRVSTPVALADLAVSLTRMAGVSPGGLAGIPFDWNDQTDDGRTVVSEAPYVAGDPVSWPTGQGWVESVFRGRWQLILNEYGTVELFDLAADPGEVINRAGDPSEAELRADLLTRLEQALPIAPAPSMGDFSSMEFGRAIRLHFPVHITASKPRIGWNIQRRNHPSPTSALRIVPQ